MAKYPNTMGRIEAVWNMLGGEEGVDRFLSGQLVVTEPSNLKTALLSKSSPKILASLLEQEGGPVFLPFCRIFVARDKFKKGNRELPISGMGSNFQNNFLDVIESDVAPMSVKQRKLLKSSLDAPILSALGDKDPSKLRKARVALAHMYEFLKTAGKGRWYIFYVADSKGVVWAVYAFWFDGGWNFEANSVTRAREWYDGSYVVSR